MNNYNWQSVDDRIPADRELVACKCGDGSMFLGFCIRPYYDRPSIKNWYLQEATLDWYHVDKVVKEFCYLERKEESPQ